MPRMVGSWEIEELDEPSKWFVLARAYLDASIHLCQEMVEGVFIANFSNAQVVMGLCHHSVELFYKGVLHASSGQFPNATHNLFDLQVEVKKVAPDVFAVFTCPFGLEELPSNLNPREKQILKKDIGKAQDQQFRYQFDRDGKPWDGIHGFIASSFLLVLKNCSSQYDAIVPSIVKPAYPIHEN
ncbi:MULTISPECIES: hypothetical protein [Methylomonas]|uniref:HEPN domain-containing protein n=2 Tax=Methylomonas TaxID=416 RepID=A0A140E5H3_9GAMM|nr:MULTISPECIES: hypothetical protein [Methylomonas]AMK75647.1 hypothetical protein JT25_003955 [Methylomonas denitrificans]OAH96146.1 hypothetical protein A1342_06665 [Methylomonas methanica]TCV75258.1 hypothetical protein EDE11_13520 [Methylomonas methanica]